MSDLELRATFARDVLNALTANIAVLDGRGIIVAVNDAWVRFAHANGATEDYVGTNYLAVCEKALLSGDDSVPDVEAVSRLRAIVAGNDDELSLEYPCDSPTERRWFTLRATRLLGESQAGAVMAHEDITARKHAEQSLLETSRELAEALERERILARVDALTGAINRRHFFDLAGHEISVAMRYHDTLALIVFDIDDFKNINDTLGHHAGDDLLRRVTEIVGRHVRHADIFARYGGDEFVILLPHTRGAEAALVAERIRSDVSARSVVTEDRTVMVTISSGIAELLSRDDTLDALIHRADLALYQAKKAGRNRTAVFAGDAPSELV